MDVIFAVVILTIGYMMISSNRISSHDEVPLALVAENTMDLLSSVTISDLCENGCDCTNGNISYYCRQGWIYNNESSLLDFFGELHSRDLNSLGETLFKDLLDDVIRTDLYNAELVIKVEPEVSIYSDNDPLKNR